MRRRACFAAGGRGASGPVDGKSALGEAVDPTVPGGGAGGLETARLGNDASARVKRGHTLVTRMSLLKARISPEGTRAGSPVGTMRWIARALVRGRDDVTVGELEAAGVGRTYAATLAASGAIRRVRHGIYGEVRDAAATNRDGDRD